MQPYLFPYAGYFQLINSVDRFIIYDDVAFIKQGWIARNRILLNGKPHLFSITLRNPSSFKNINEIQLHERLYATWRNKFYKTITQGYKSAPFFSAGFELIESVFDMKPSSIAELSRNSVASVCKYLNIETEIVPTSEIYKNSELKGKERIIDICKLENAITYVNLPGGIDLYSKVDFVQEGLELKFIQPEIVPYKQFNNPFAPNLSIIDLLMFNSVSECGKLLDAYTLE